MVTGERKAEVNEKTSNTNDVEISSSVLITTALCSEITYHRLTTLLKSICAVTYHRLTTLLQSIHSHLPSLDDTAEVYLRSHVPSLDDIAEVNPQSLTIA